MRGFTVFLGKEFAEIFSTWRIWVLPMIMIGIGILSPITAELMPQLVASMAESTPGLVIELPPSSILDSYAQFSQNLTQIVLIAVIIAVAGMVASEKRTGTAILMLTKPVSRASFVLAKVISNITLLVGATVIGTGVFWAASQVFFVNEFTDRMLAMVGLWLLLAAMMIAIMALFSVLLGSQAGAAGAGLGVYLAMSILGLWRPAAEYSPAGLIGLGDRILAGTETVVIWPALTAVAVAVLATAAAVLVFRRQEI